MSSINVIKDCILPLSPVLFFITAILHVAKVAGLGIIGGEPAFNYPFFVKIEVAGELCGGTLIAADAVLTAAHCLDNRRKGRRALFKEVQVFKTDYTDRNWRKTQAVYSCELYVQHKNYNPDVMVGRSPFDIAIIKLKECIDLRNSDNGILEPCPDGTKYGEGLAIGMGLVSRNPNLYAEILMGTHLYAYSRCATHARRHGVLIDEGKQICYAGSKNGRTTGTSYGDSGGPIVYKRKPRVNAICLIGIESFGADYCNIPKFPSVFTRVDYFRDWIKITYEGMVWLSSWSCTISK